MHQHVYWYRCSMRNSNFPLQSVLRSAMSIADHVADSALSVKPLPIPGFFFCRTPSPCNCLELTALADRQAETRRKTSDEFPNL